MTKRALLVTPSKGLGGGIERYVNTLEWAFLEENIDYARVDLRHHSGWSRATAHAQLLRQARAHLRSGGPPIRIVVCHRGLLPVAWLLARDGCVEGVSVVCHGTDVWGHRPRFRSSIENCLMGNARVRVVAVSSFTAGALTANCQATILPPALSQRWFKTLVGAASDVRRADEGVRIVTAFRLGDWRSKGLPQIVEAVDALGVTDIQVVVCGSGEPPAALRALVRAHQFCSLRVDLTDHDLADQFASADLCVLATRTRSGRDPSGEGFGLVLLEAQVAGTPVVGPAFGGSHDAYVEGVTGATPTDESAAALTEVLRALLSDRSKLTKMGKQAADWSRQSFAPTGYAKLTVARLL